MFKVIETQTEIVRLRNENTALKAENAKLQSNLDYLAMMSDVDLDEDDESEAAEDE
jgi:regulator of replication initiation timing